MSIEYFSFLLASLVIIVIPGPNVLVIVATSLSRGRRSGLQTVAGTSLAMLIQLVVAALGTGLLFDALSLDPMGANGIAFLAVALLGASAGRRFFQASIFPPIPITFLATWIYALIVLIIRASESGGAPLSALAPLILLQALLNSLLVVLVYPVTRLLSRSIVSTQ